MNSLLKYALKLEKLFVVRIEDIVNLTTSSLRLVYNQMRLQISCLNPLPTFMGERVGFQLNEAYVFLGVYLLQTQKCFIISVMIKKKSN